VVVNFEEKMLMKVLTEGFFQITNCVLSFEEWEGACLKNDILQLISS
jgi:hypothetical protein